MPAKTVLFDAEASRHHRQARASAAASRRAIEAMARNGGSENPEPHDSPLVQGLLGAIRANGKREGAALYDLNQAAREAGVMPGYEFVVDGHEYLASTGRMATYLGRSLPDDEDSSDDEIGQMAFEYQLATRWEG